MPLSKLAACLALALALGGCGQGGDDAGGSAGGTPDTAFGSGGVASAQVEPQSYDRATALALQADGKAVLAGTSSIAPGRFVVRRFLSGGALDAAFGTGGKAVIRVSELDAEPAAAAIQADGKILVVGRATASFAPLDNDLVVVRLTTSGALDAGFGEGGVARLPVGTNDWGTDLAVQPDGKILATGTRSHGDDSDLVVARFDATGQLDEAFGDGGVAALALRNGPAERHQVWGEALALGSGGTIAVAATARRIDSTYSEAEAALVQLTSLGAPDATFSADGVAWLGTGVHLRDVAVQPDGRVVAAGYTTVDDGDFWLGRFTAAGAPDPTFGQGGAVQTSFGAGADAALALARDAAGRFVAAGQAWDVASYVVALARYTADGAPDTEFGAGGRTTRRLGAQDSANAVAVGAGDRILVAGESRLAGDPPQSRMVLLRYLP